MTVHSTGDDPCGHLATQPPGAALAGHNGRDYSRLGNWHDWLGFFERPAGGGRSDFVGVYDTAANEGVARVFPPQVARGTKGFGIGWSRPD